MLATSIVGVLLAAFAVFAGWFECVRTPDPSNPPNSLRAKLSLVRPIGWILFTAIAILTFINITMTESQHASEVRQRERIEEELVKASDDTKQSKRVGIIESMVLAMQVEAEGYIEDARSQSKEGLKDFSVKTSETKHWDAKLARRGIEASINTIDSFQNKLESDFGMERPKIDLKESDPLKYLDEARAMMNSKRYRSSEKACETILEICERVEIGLLGLTSRYRRQLLEKAYPQP